MSRRRRCCRPRPTRNAWAQRLADCLLRIRAIVERPTRCPGFLRAPWILSGGSYNLEIKHLALAHAFPFVDTVVFLVAETNWRSQRAMEKIGGVRRPELQPRFLTGQIDGHVVFEITKRDFHSSAIWS